MASTLVILGTASSVGKSWVATGLCRLLARRGYRVAPFKALNMSNNAAPARSARGGWGEIGRAQAAQAAAAGLAPHVDMNPLLLKPERMRESAAGGPRGAQVVVLGEALGEMEARRYREEAGGWWEVARAAYDRLAAEHDIIVVEGAGSPAEINLLDQDIANLRIARYAVGQARAAGQPGAALLVGDIDRGGVFAALYGTLALIPEEDRALFAGLIINRFRGDARLLAPGPALLEARAGVPVRGVLPWRPDIRIDEEDCEELRADSGEIDVCALRLPTVSNFTDVSSLAAVRGVGVRYAGAPGAVGNPDLLVIPGSKDTIADLRWLRRRGLDRSVIAAAARGVPVLGLCGGYQILGERVADPGGVGGAAGDEPGLGLLPVRTTFSALKAVREAAGATRGGWLLPPGLPVRGYEIHQGETTASAAPLVDLAEPDGAVAGLVAGTYLHGLLDSAPAREALVAALRRRKGLDPLGEEVEDVAAFRMRQYDAAADVLAQHLDLSGLLPEPR